MTKVSEERVFEWHTVVDFADTDAGGVVYYARYLDWAERARASWLRGCNSSNRQLWEQGIVFVVTRVEIDYKQSARLEDSIVLETTVNKIKGVRLIMNQNIYRRSDRALLCSCIVTLACLDRHKHKPTKIPSFIAHKSMKLSN
ncbi:MAG: tol-pal system-associated acyl-CoA thioesterase [Pleurocapsa sp.]